MRGPDAGEKQQMSRRKGCRCLASPGTETLGSESATDGPMDSSVCRPILQLEELNGINPYFILASGSVQPSPTGPHFLSQHNPRSHL